MDAPALFDAQRIAGDWTVLPSWLPVPGAGALAVNGFLLEGREPLLVDTGLAALGEPYLHALESRLDLDDLRWIWLSHMDADHVGNLPALLERAPNATVVTNFLGAGKMMLAGLDVSRVRQLQPGEALEVAGRRLHPLRPPYYDAPETIGFFEDRDRVLFAADAFGALLVEPAHDIAEVAPESLRDGLVGWSSVDAPWLATADRDALGRTLVAIERLDPEIVLSGHLPLVRGGVSRLTRHIADAYCRGTTDAVDPLSMDHLLAMLEAGAAA